MNWIDILIIIGFIWYAIDGYRRGFFELVLEFLSFAVATFLALLLDRQVGGLISHIVNIPASMQRPFGFVVLWFLIQLLLMFVVRYSYRYVPKSLSKAILNKVVGIVPSLAKGLILIAIILLLFVTMPISGRLKDTVMNSYLGGEIVKRSSGLEGVISRIFGGTFGDMATLITTGPPAKTTTGAPQIIQPDERIGLGFQTTDVSIDVRSEEVMLNLINEARAKSGLKILSYDPLLRNVARAHALDMLKAGYFSHINLQGETPFDRLSKAGIAFQAAGENLALAPNVNLAFDGLMNSPGHRANILEPKFGRAGIGVIDAGVYGKMFVQEFQD